MTRVSSPGWLVPAFVRSARAAGATVPDAQIQRAGARLLERWEDEARKFHNVRHLVELLQHVDELQQETHHPHTVRLAAWYHGAVFASDADAAYEHRGGEDEVASADYARGELIALGVPDATADDVATMVQALARHAAIPVSIDCAVLCDADLAILAADPQRYKEYTREVREEYAHIPDKDFLSSRKAILEKLMKRDRLYISPLGTGWETQARQNVTGEIARITRELATIESSDRS